MVGGVMMMSGSPPSGICGAESESESDSSPPLPVTGVRGVVRVLATRSLTSAGPFGEPSPVAVLAPVDELLVVALAPRLEPPNNEEDQSSSPQPNPKPPPNDEGAAATVWKSDEGAA